MKKVLVTGAAGAVGLSLIKYLLAEGKYEITALDLKNKKVYKRLKRYRKRINIVYGDVLDRPLVENLVKDSDVVIHLSTCLPPLAEYKKDLVDMIEYNGTENIVRAINYYNPKCYLVYASTTSLYKNNEGHVDNKIKLGDYDYYNEAKYNSEKLIIKKAKNHTIIRVPLVLSDLRCESFIYNLKKDDIIEFISKEDAAYAFCRTLDKQNVLNKKIINIGGGATCRSTYRELLINILKYHGISFNYLLTMIFIAKNYTSPVLLDSDKANEILNFRNDSVQSYLMRQKRRSHKRKVAIVFGKPFIWLLQRKVK
ncbi:MAG: NAD(P)-dependent oxidoreductase [Firmicutes bacterium]|nr:NAD(P)-dependent oxidoreductase [Bacillota bacterium]